LAFVVFLDIPLFQEVFYFLVNGFELWQVVYAVDAAIFLLWMANLAVCM
jgi:hypothetical protein